VNTNLKLFFQGCPSDFYTDDVQLLNWLLGHAIKIKYRSNGIIGLFLFHDYPRLRKLRRGLFPKDVRSLFQGEDAHNEWVNGAQLLNFVTWIK
jgi:hypothetical protein